MATCNTNSLFAAGVRFLMLDGNMARTARLGLWKALLLQIEAGADVTPETLLARGACFACISPEQQRVAKLQLLCDVLSSTPGDTICACSVPVLTSVEQTSDSAPYTVLIQWTFDAGVCEGGYFEIWRNVDGGDFSLWVQPAQSETSYANNGNNPAGSEGQTIGFKVRYINGDLVCDFSNELTVELQPA